jgi:hypothetical protein
MEDKAYKLADDPVNHPPHYTRHPSGMLLNIYGVPI